MKNKIKKRKFTEECHAFEIMNILDADEESLNIKSRVEDEVWKVSLDEKPTNKSKYSSWT